MTHIKSNHQILTNDKGLPVFVVLPYDEYINLQKISTLDYTDTIPSEVINKVYIDHMTPIKAWREYLNYTQENVAKMLNITQSAYQQQETAKRLTKNSKIKIAKVFNIDVELLNI